MKVRTNQITIPSTIEKIEEACEFVSAEARTAGLSEDAVYHCHLSVEEVLTNVIEHGYNYEEDHVIDLKTEHHNSVFVISVIDDAEPFDPLAQPDPDPSTPLWERKEGGWGIFFVKKYMDQLDYQYDDGRNHFIMKKGL